MPANDRGESGRRLSHITTRTLQVAGFVVVLLALRRIMPDPENKKAADRIEATKRFESPDHCSASGVARGCGQPGGEDASVPDEGLPPETASVERPSISASPSPVAQV